MALRRVATDMKALGRIQDLQMRRSQMAMQRSNLARQKLLAQRNLATMKQGTAAYSKQAHAISTLAQKEALLGQRQKMLNNVIRAAKWEKFGTLSRMMGHFGRVTQMAGLVAGAALGYAANAAANFDQQAQLVATQTGKVGTGVGQIVKNAAVLRKGLLAVAASGRSSFEQVNDAAYDLFSTFDQLGDSRRGLSQGLKIMRLFSDASIAGLTDINTVTNGVVASLTAFDEIPKTAAGVNRILQRMFAAVRFGRMTFAEFAQVLGTTAPAARAAGQSFDTMAGTIAFLSRPLGINKASVGFARLSEIFSRKKFQEGLKNAGVSITKANGALLPFPAIIQRLATAFPKLTKGGGEINRFFKAMGGTEGTIQARRAFVFLMQGMDEYLRVLGKTTKDNNEFSRSLDAMSRTSGVRWAKFMNQIKALFIELGEAAIPTLMELVKPLQQLIKWYANLSDETKKTIGRTLALAAAFALIGGTLLTVGGAILSFSAMLGKMGILFKSLSIFVIAATVAIAAFKGHWTSLGDILRGTANAIFGSWQGFIAGSVLAIAAIKKVGAAWAAIQLASTAGMAGSGATGLAGLFAGGRRAANDARGIRAVAKEAGGLRGAFLGASVAASMIPGPLMVAGGVIATMGVAALLWQKHMDGVRKHAAEAAAEMARIKSIMDAPLKAAAAFGQFGARSRTLERAKLDYKDLVARVKTLKDGLKGLRGEELQQARRDVRRAILDRADAWDVLNDAQNKALSAKGALADFFARQANKIGEMATQQARLNKLGGFLNLAGRPAQAGDIGRLKDMAKELGLGGSLSRAIHTARSEFSALNQSITSLRISGDRDLLAFNTNFTKTVKALQAAEILPGAKKGAIANLAAFAREVGRMPTLKEMKMILKVGVTPDLASLKKLPALIQNFYAKRKLADAKAKVQVAISMIRVTKGEHGSIPAQITKQLKKESAKVAANVNVIARTKGAIEKLKEFAKQKRTTTVGVKARTKQAMNDVEALLAWIRKQSASIKIKVDKTTVNNVVDQAAKQAKDPTNTRKIANALFSNRAAIRQAFAGPIKEAILEGRQLLGDLFARVEDLRDIPGSDKKRPLSSGLLIKSANMQVGALRQYYKSLDRLAKRGVPDSLLAQLQELGIDGAKYLKMLADATPKQLKKFIRAWNVAQAAISKNANSMKNILRMLSNNISSGAEGLLNIYNDFKSQIESIFGGLGEGLDMSFKLSPAKIFASLQKQAANFATFTSTLNSLIAKKLPFKLIQQILAMGPDALNFMTGLNGMTAGQLAQYIKLWQDAQAAIDVVTKQMTKAQVKEWQKMGKTIATGIIAGLISEQGALIKFFTNMFKNLLKVAKNETGSHSPSRVYMKLGQDMVEGLAIGMNMKPKVPLPAINPAAMSPSHGGVNMTVNAHHTETLDSTLARANFRLRNRV